KTLAVGAGWGEDPLSIWDVATRKKLRSCRPTRRVFFRRMAFSPDGKLVASGGHCTAVRLWDPATGAEKAVLGKADEDAASLSLASSPDSKTLAAVWEQTVCVWDVGSGEELRRFGPREERLGSLAIAPDGRTLVTGSLSGTVRLWDLATGKETRCLTQLESTVVSLAFSPDGKMLASACQSGTLDLWDVDA